MSNTNGNKYNKEWVTKRIKECVICVNIEGSKDSYRNTNLDLSEVMSIVYRDSEVKSKQEKINFEAQSLLAKIVHTLRLFENNAIDELVEAHPTCNNRKDYLSHIFENAQKSFFVEVYPLISNNLSREHFVTSNKLFASEMTNEALPNLGKKDCCITIQQIAYYHVNVMRLIANNGVEFDRLLKKRKVKL